MKKLIKKMKGKKVLSLVLAALMLATTFNIALPMLKLDANAAGSITSQDGTETITQTQIVDASTRTETYEGYATQFLDGASRPLDMVIPGLDPAQDYVIQGMTYYPKRDWMLITAYHNYDADNDAQQFSSKVFALDAATGEFVAMFSFLNPDGSVNTDHGGGIAVSEHNIYYACGDADRKIAYAPISALENAELNKHTVIQLAAEHVFTEVGSVNDGSETAYTAYVCYDEGILWTGNFYDPGVKILGVSVAATDYSVPANNDYKSMVFGYKLKGNSSEAEWANLTASAGTDRQGNPSYAIGLNNAIKDVQYATVDNGKLYLSCSFGTGEGTNSVTLGSMRPYSQLIVADIDLSVAGTETITIATSTGTAQVLAYDIQDYKLYDMMPMSEGLCVIEDKIYITFESASNKYLNEAGALTGNCNYPIDVVWELDPYELMEIEKAEPENSIYYEKVNGPADIINGEEYIIVYESDEEDPVTQQKILYAFDSDGNFKDYKLSKSAADNLKGYDGMVGHPITEYSILKAGEQDALGNTYSRDILYLDDKENDDVESVRWTITNIGGTKYSIKTTATYFANCNSFYFDADRITMLPSSATTHLSNMDIGQLVADNGYFYFSNNGAYLWCNDGLNETYNTKANAYYAANAGTTPIYSGLTEIPGTIHCNALGSAILGGSISDAEEGKAYAYPDGAFQIYRRVTDSAASTYESRVFTDLKAELQADGTYTVDLETYAISPNHYQYVGERPTDYILVADTSSSMSTADSTGIIAYGSSNELSVETLSGSADDTADTNGVGVIGYGFSDPAQDIYFLHTDGEYYKIYLAVNTVEFNQFIGITTSFRQRYWAYYVTDDGMYHVLQTSGVCNGSDGGVFDPITREEFINHVDNSSTLGDESKYSSYSTKTGNGDRRGTIVFKGAHYRFTTSEEFTRLQTIQTVANDLIDDIAAQNSNNRIALVKYGADASSGFYNTSSALSTTDYANAFFSASAKDTVKGLVNGLTTSEQTNNSGIEMDYVNALISNSGVDYKATGDRNVIVIFMSDAIPGADANSATASAADAVINKALTAKKNGAFIYSVITGQASVSGFNKKTYMEAVSTKYAAATGMSADKLGGQSIDGVNYLLNLSSCTIDTFCNFGSVAMDETEVNTTVGLENLNASAFLRQELSDSFIIPEGTQPVASFIEGKFDAIGRFSFDEENPTTDTNVIVTPVDGAGHITVTGYDYSSQYIAKGKTGNKLRIRIEGVLADETKVIQNTPISNTSTTALYKNETAMEAGNVFKQLPTRYFNIPKYTYVLDYGLQLLDTDVNGTLKSVSDGLKAQRNATTGDIEYNNASPNGLVAIADNSLDLFYHTTPTNTTDSGYVLIQRDSGEYDWFEIEVVPASNVYFEETEFATDNGTGTVEWATTTGGTSATYRDLPAENDVDGYDTAYDNTNTYSNGTTLSASVDSTNKRSKTATVSFAGDGIDIVSACGPTTGMQIINIKDADTKKSVAASIVDTYYADATFSQVPVFSWRGAYGDYIVETTAVYLSTAGALKKSGFKSSLVDTGLVMNSSDNLNTANVQVMLDAAGVEDIDVENLELVWFDDNSVLNGGTGVAPAKKGARAGETTTVTLNNYIDGFRIYNPLGADSSSYAVAEQGAVYHNVIDSLVNGTLSDGSLDFASGTVAFVTGSLADGETLSFANYESIGPKNELYLKGNATNGVTFKTPVADGGKVMISLRAVNGATTVNINGNTFTVTSATEMYYDITELLTVTDGKANVTIINSGNGILAVNNIKLTNAAASSNLMLLSSEDLETAQYYASTEPVEVNVKNGVVTPVVEEDVTDNDTNTDNDNTNTDSGEDKEFNIFSLIEILIAFIEKILRGAFGSGKLI